QQPGQFQAEQRRRAEVEQVPEQLFDQALVGAVVQHPDVVGAKGQGGAVGQLAALRGPGGQLLEGVAGQDQPVVPQRAVVVRGRGSASKVRAGPASRCRASRRAFTSGRDRQSPRSEGQSWRSASPWARAKARRRVNVLDVVNDWKAKTETGMTSRTARAKW